jgi:3-oxoacyl-[acyl-carrier-protein] synthase-1
LGAAGITEAIVSAVCIQQGFMPGNLNTRVLDNGFTSHALLENKHRPVAHVLSNSFGFGGSNCSLIFGAVT